MGQFFASRVVRAVLSVLIGVALLGGAFYGGRVYQNNEDQSLFTAYSPPTPGGLGGGGGASASGAALGAGAGSGFGGSGSGGGANAQVNAALAVGNVPAVSTPDPSSGGYIASSNTTAASGGVGGRRRRGVFGQFVSLANGTLTIQSFLGSQSYPTSSDLSYYRVVATHQVAVGDRVAIGTDSSGAVQSVTISPNGLPYISVRACGGGGFGGGGQGAAGGASGGFGSGGASTGSGGFGSGGASAGGGFGSGGASAGGASAGGGGFGGGTTVLTGTVVTATGGALTIKTITGTTQVVPLTSASALYQVQSATASAFKAGAMVAARTTPLNGQTAVSAIVAVAATGALATFAS